MPRYANLLKEFGFRTNLTGYHAAKEALAVMETMPMPAKMADVYKQVSKKINKTNSKVESSIRNAIDYPWIDDNPLMLQHFNHRRPCVSEFLHEVLEMVRMEKGAA